MNNNKNPSHQFSEFETECFGFRTNVREYMHDLSILHILRLEYIFYGAVSVDMSPIPVC